MTPGLMQLGLALVRICFQKYSSRWLVVALHTYPVNIGLGATYFKAPVTAGGLKEGLKFADPLSAL